MAAWLDWQLEWPLECPQDGAIREAWVSGLAIPTVRFEVLGPLQAWHQHTRLALGSVQQRVVLAVLLLNANRTTSREEIIDGVWGSVAPTYAVNLLQKHVSALRRALEPAHEVGTQSRLLIWTDGGYLLSVPPGGLDLELFHREVKRARVARAAGDLRAAAESLHTATGLWRGLAFDGLSSPLLDTERRQLAERRISTVEERIEVDLALGKHLELVAELQHLVSDHPLRERLRGQLMLSLYRSGRLAEALSAFRDAREYLVEELGIEPTAELQRFHQQILAADPALAAPPGAGHGPANAVTARPSEASLAPGPPTPAQLPPAMPYFTGRKAELGQLHTLLDRDTGAEWAVLIATITGTAGVGKSALAVHWAHQVRDRFPDGQLYVNLRGFEPTGSAMDPAEAIRGFLDAFAVPNRLIPVPIEGQAALYRSLLNGRRVLVVLDNARDAEQVRPLLPGSPGCLVVVTSRLELSGLVAAEGARPITLDLLSLAESRDLLARRLGPEQLRAEPEAAHDIIASCAGLPLALAVVAARFAARPGFPLGIVAQHLREARGSLDAFDGDDRATDVRAVFSWSYRMLRPKAAQLFRLLGLHPSPHTTTAAAASLAGTSRREAAASLAALAQAHLVDEQVPNCFTLHDLLRAYAAEQVRATDAEAVRHDALHRMLDHYLHSAHAADRLLNPYRDQFTIGRPRPGVTVEVFADQREALNWFTAEHPILMATVELAANERFDTHAWQLAWSLTTYFDHNGHWHDSASAQRTALAAAQRLADPDVQARVHRGLGRAFIQLDRGEFAFHHLHRALGLYAELGDHVGRGRTHLNLAALLSRSGDNREALSHTLQALELFTTGANPIGQADALNGIGWYHAQLGNHREALESCQQALALHQQLGDREGEAYTWDSLGYAHSRLGDIDEAIACYRRAWQLWRDVGDRYYEAKSLVSVGDIHHAAGDVEAASAAWHLAVTILHELGHPEADFVRAKLKDIGQPDPSPSRWPVI